MRSQIPIRNEVHADKSLVMLDAATPFSRTRFAERCHLRTAEGSLSGKTLLARFLFLISPVKLCWKFEAFKLLLSIARFTKFIYKKH